MATSQLKRLKASLREQGGLGPQKSKREKRQASKDGKDKQIARSVALASIREQFNPFEVKKLTRGTKFGALAAGNAQNNGGVIGRPGITRGIGEEVRKQTLLTEMQRRKKVGGILDRRFGEDDPTMTPEERALERFVKEKQKGIKKRAAFDLEDEGNDMIELTHLGQSLLHPNDNALDDFIETDLRSLEENDTDSAVETRGKKRLKLSLGDIGADALKGETQPEDGKLKTKQEVMKEIMAKSKLYKYERQKAREDDDELRNKLDEGLNSIYELMRGANFPRRGNSPKAGAVEPFMDADRVALLEGKNRAQADKEYDERLRQMAFDARSKPTTRTKTAEETAAEDAERLKELEEQRLLRMRGEEHDEADYQLDRNDQGAESDTEATPLGKGIPTQPARRQLHVEDEDDFALEEDLIANVSEIDLSLETEDTSAGSDSALDEGSEEEGEFTARLVSDDVIKTPENQSKFLSLPKGSSALGETQLAFTYHCPQNHKELLEITLTSSASDLPTIIQRIRALYHPQLASENKRKLGTFAKVLVKHIDYLANQPIRPSFIVLEAVIRHVHSLAKSFPGEVGEAFRDHLQTINTERPLALKCGDFVIFTAIGTIFPTSDHFHQIVSPALLCIARFLGQRRSHSLAELAKGIYLCTLCAQYQGLSKRYLPEVVNYIMSALTVLSPEKVEGSITDFLTHGSPDFLRIKQSSSIVKERGMNFWDIQHKEGENDEELKTASLNTAIRLLSIISGLWQGNSAYCEIFQPFTKVLLNVTSTTLSECLCTAALNRKPLALHSHRPLAIKTAIPKFEESFHPDRHYDADRDRTELAKLRAEHKRERKGALRELRKDASFVARENLREKKERDVEYEKKYRRLVAEVQGEEGREANAYEREKRSRKKKAKGF